MKVMSVSEFDAWQKASGRRVFILDTDNNAQLLNQAFHAVLRFSAVTAGKCCSRLAFRNGDSTLCLERIKEVRMYDRRNRIGAVFDVVCCLPDGQTQAWRFLAD